ncbi:hypothetical protein Z517_00388 [Fonsecaea pedrosoi CBS 271.37]|uniref:Uncharacterized protein n=1 Tax=Fonsecaea pedrosoi CBS 271.37 TaxID=1442368 RepID=A0A0D2H2G1_9EURO|nr:uncharacterized protein Z517_00388 [Fonsecaea pedrosoi CBS 271.37]KIW85000.1 hypothetical protein Z517_00388 [Fonsecaea pedrosoi CBS 271.37]
MSAQVPRPRWIGGKSRSSAWFGLAKLCMHDEYMRVEAIRRSRRDRARATILAAAAPEAVTASETGGDREAAEAEEDKDVADGERPHGGEDQGNIEEVENEAAANTANVAGVSGDIDLEGRESIINDDPENAAASQAQSKAHSVKASITRSHAGSNDTAGNGEAQQNEPSPQPSKAPSAGTRNSPGARPANVSPETAQELQRAPSTRRMSAVSSLRSGRPRTTVGQQTIDVEVRKACRISSPRPSRVCSNKMGNPPAVSGHHSTTCARQESVHRSSPLLSRAASPTSRIAEWRARTVDSQDPGDETAFGRPFRPACPSVPASISPSTSSRLSQTTTLTSISQRPQGHTSAPVSACVEQAASSAQQGAQTPTGIGDQAALRLQTWNWAESQRHSLEYHATHRYEQSAQHSIAPHMVQRQHQTSTGPGLHNAIMLLNLNLNSTSHVPTHTSIDGRHLTLQDILEDRVLLYSMAAATII